MHWHNLHCEASGIRRYQWAGCLTCVGADVTSEQPRPRKGLAAGGAHAGQRVGADVHLERAQAVVLLGAVFAVEAGAAGRGSGHRRRCCRRRDGGGGHDCVHASAVGQLVSGEGSRTAAALTTVCTLEALCGVRARGV